MLLLLVLLLLLWQLTVPKLKLNFSVKKGHCHWNGSPAIEMARRRVH